MIQKQLTGAEIVIQALIDHKCRGNIRLSGGGSIADL